MNDMNDMFDLILRCAFDWILVYALITITAVVLTAIVCGIAKAFGFIADRILDAIAWIEIAWIEYRMRR